MKNPSTATLAEPSTMQRDQKSRYDKKEEYVTSSSENEVDLSLVVTEIQAMLARSVKVKPRQGIKNRVSKDWRTHTAKVSMSSWRLAKSRSPRPQRWCRDSRTKHCVPSERST